MRRQLTPTILFTTVFLDLLGFGMVLPLMPLYAADPRFNASPVEIGWLMAIYSLMQFLFAPLWGRLSDKFGRRPVLIFGLFGSSLSYGVYGLGESLTTLFLARAVAGVMGANIATAQASMADITTSERRAHGMGMIGAAFSLGFVLGPATGALLSQWDLAAAPLAASLLTGLNGIAALFFLAESHPDPGGTLPPHPLTASLWRYARTLPNALTICLLMGVFITLFAAFEVTLPLYGKERLGWTISTVGWIFAYVGVLMALIQGGIVRKLAPVIGERRMVGIGMVALATGFVVIASVNNTTGVLLALAPIAVGAGLVHPGLSSLVSLHTPEGRQGTMMGLFQSMSALGRVLGPVIGGSLFLFAGGSGLFFVISIAMVVLFFVFVLTTRGVMR